MSLKAEKCPNCGANVELDDEQEFGFCKYCGTKVLKSNMQSNTQKIEIENPVKIGGKIELVNNDLEAKLGQVELAIDIFLNKKVINDFDYMNVGNMLSQLESIGANDSRYYLDFCNFYINGNFKAFDQKKRQLTDKDEFLLIYDTAMKNAIKHAPNEMEKEKINSKYEEEREYVIKKLNYYQYVRKKTMRNYFLVFFIPFILLLLLLIIVSFL